MIKFVLFMYICVSLSGCHLATDRSDSIPINPKWREDSAALVKFGVIPANSKQDPKWTYCTNKQDGYIAERDLEFSQHIDRTTNMEFVGCEGGHAVLTNRDRR